MKNFFVLLALFINGVAFATACLNVEKPYTRTWLCALFYLIACALFYLTAVGLQHI